MKIRKPDENDYLKISGLLQRAFNPGQHETKLVETLRKNKRDIKEWVCIHKNKAVAYIAFSNAYQDGTVCGLHLGPMAVSPEFQYQGTGSELMNFALRQKSIKDNNIFVLGKPDFYKKFGFEPCTKPACPFDKKNKNFLMKGSLDFADFKIGYEPEFYK